MSLAYYFKKMPANLIVLLWCNILGEQRGQYTVIVCWINVVFNNFIMNILSNDILTQLVCEYLDFCGV